MFEIENDKERIYQTITESEKNSLFILPCKTIQSEENLAKLWSENLNLQSIDLGFELSKKLSSGYSEKYLNIEIEEILNQIIEDFQKEFIEFRKKLLLLYNVGILWEPKLKLSPETIFKKIVKHTNLILIWHGSINAIDNKIFLMENNSDYFTELKEIQIYICKE